MGGAILVARHCVMLFVKWTSPRVPPPLSLILFTSLDNNAGSYWNIDSADVSLAIGC